LYSCIRTSSLNLDGRFLIQIAQQVLSSNSEVGFFFDVFLRTTAGDVDCDRSLLEDEEDDPDDDEDREEDEEFDDELLDPPLPADFLLESESETLDRDALLDFLVVALLHFLTDDFTDWAEPEGVR